MNFQRQIAQLNKRFGDEFGYTPTGHPKFKWVQTSEMFYHLDNRSKVSQVAELVGGPLVQSTGGIFMPVGSGFERKCWADLHGNCWMLAMWHPPISCSEWLAKYGLDFPWPKDGEYHLVENVKLGAGEVPTEDLTQQATWAIYKHMERTFEQHKQLAEEATAKTMKEKTNRIEDEAEDLMTAFLNVPGKKGHVSFGGIEASQLQ